MGRVEPFSIDLSDHELTELLARVGQPGNDLADGVLNWKCPRDQAHFEQLCQYWSHEFNWKKQQQNLNQIPQFTLEIDGVRVHFVHVRAVGGNGVPLLLAHSWPSTFLEYVPAISMLTDPRRHGLTGPAFDVVIPSIPGFGFSERPRGSTWSYAHTAKLWHRLMDELGYSRIAAVGTGFGAGIVTMMAQQQAKRLIGIYLNSLDVSRPPCASQALSTAEMLSLAQSDAWENTEVSVDTGPMAKSNMLSFALTESPIGIAAWIVQQWRVWAGPEADLSDRRDYDALLTMLSLYWLTGTVGSSLLDYYDNRAEPPLLEPGTKIDVPTSATVFSDPGSCRSREWMTELYQLESLIEVPRVGRFGVIHDPQCLSSGIGGLVQKVMARDGNTSLYFGGEA